MKRGREREWHGDPITEFSRIRSKKRREEVRLEDSKKQVRILRRRGRKRGEGGETLKIPSRE